MVNGIVSVIKIYKWFLEMKSHGEKNYIEVMSVEQLIDVNFFDLPILNLIISMTWNLTWVLRKLRLWW